VRGGVEVGRPGGKGWVTKQLGPPQICQEGPLKKGKRRRIGVAAKASRQKFGGMERRHLEPT